MTVIQPGVFALIERFPEYESAIKAQYLQSESFQTLCSDYKKCAAAVEYWKRSPDGEAAQRSKEYQDLLAELEEEVLQTLGESD